MIIEVRDGTQVEFPDDTPEEEINRALAEAFPPQAEDIAAQLKADPDYVPSKADYALFEGWKDENASGFISGAIEAVPELVGKAGRGLAGILDVTSWFENGTNPLATIGESGAQGTAQLYGLLAQSANPNSPAFYFKDLITGDGTLDSRYDQFLEARKFQKKLQDYETGKDAVLPGSKERANLQVASDLSVLVDPTLMLGPAKALAMTGKLGAGALKAAEAIGKVENLAGKIVSNGVAAGADAVSAAGKAVSGGMEAVGRKVGETLAEIKGVGSPAVGAAAGLGATQIPGVGTAAGVYAGAKVAQIGGELAGEAARAAFEAPSRLSTLERLAASPTLSLGARNVASAMLPLDPLLQLGGAMARGGAEGAVVGGALGYYGSGTAEGAGQGAGAGFGLGAAGGVVGKGIERLAGVGRKEAIGPEVAKEINAMPEAQRPMAAKAFQRFMDGGNYEAAAELIDVKRWLGKAVDFQFVDNATAKATFEAQFPGQKYVFSQGFAGVNDAGKPAVFINADNVKPGTGYHEALHGAVRTAIGREFGGRMAEYLQNTLNPTQLSGFISDYLGRANPKDRKSLLAGMDMKTPEGLKVTLEEISADQFSQFLQRSEFRDYLMRGGRDWGGIFLGFAKDTIGKLSDSVGLTDFGAQRGFERIAKELIKAQRIIAREEMVSGKVPIPLDLTGKSPKELEAWAGKHGQTDVLIRDQNGNTVGVKDPVKAEADRVVKNERIYKTIEEHAKKAGASTKGGIKLNRRMLEKYKDAIPTQDYVKASALMDAMESGSVVQWNSYFPTNRKLNRSERSVKADRGEFQVLGVPYELAITKKGGLIARILDFDTIKNRADDYLGREGMLKPWNGDKGAAMADLGKYINNLGDSHSKPSVDVLGDAQKRDILYKIVGGKLRIDQAGDIANQPSTGINTADENQAGRATTIGKPDPLQGNNTAPINSLRLDLMGEFAPTGEKLNFNLGAYEKSKVNWLPAETIGQTEIIKSQEGFKIVHGQKWRLYDKSEKLVGIYGTEAEAIKKAEKLK